MERLLAQPDRARRATVERDWKWGSKMISVTESMPPGFKASKISLSAASRSGISPRTVTSTARSNRLRPSLPSPSPLSRNRILARFAASAFSRARSTIPAWISMATTSPRGPTCLAIGMATRPGPQPASSTAMPSCRSKRSTMTAARLVLVKGLSTSTSQRSDTGQGTEWRREPTRHMTATRPMTPTKARRT